MAAIKRTPADVWFSKCVRERVGWRCEKCGTQHQENSQGLGCSHHHGRGAWSIRFDPLNAESLCTACHYGVGGTQRRRETVLTDDQQTTLFRRMDDIALGRQLRKTKGKGGISAHYKAEYERMRDRRTTGEIGRIEFSAWIP